MLALSPEGKDFSAYLEALFCKAKLRNAAGDYTESLEMLENLQRTCDEYGIEYLYAQVLLAINRIRFMAAAPQTPFASLNVLLKSVEICRNHDYDILLAEAHVVLAEVYIAKGKPQDAYALINDQMPVVIEHGSVTLRAKTMVARIKGLEDGTNGEVGPAANKAMELLRASEEMFALVQNVSRLKEICYLQALMYNHMALQAERCGKDSTAFCTSREEAAAMFSSVVHN
ncbi:hypothetical protein PsorP6_008672 [Peronosclerospora sorghi]|uniref:Uncharacterized protein n=1 Tax=Peronosclerospora sorghi TaxID=230839 RepID=A0ACC0W1E4_9STRA|nr:hypothetical protein PsorP6_008672 [Peronosclerospora sorghi]